MQSSLGNLCRGQKGKIWSRLKAEDLFSLSFLVKVLPTSLLHPCVNLVSFLKGRAIHRHYRSTALFPHLSVSSNLRAPRMSQSPGMVGVTHPSLHLTAAVVSTSPASELCGRAEMWLCKALLHLKGSSSKQSNSKPVGLAPSELLTGFSLIMLCSRSTGCFMRGQFTR